MLSSEEDRPCDPAGILALKEEGFGLAVLEAEDLAITADVKLALFRNLSARSPSSRLTLIAISQSGKVCQSSIHGRECVEPTFPG